MDDIYKPGAVASLIHLQTSPTEKSKKQKKLDKLFGWMTKSSASFSQVPFSNVSKNVTIDLKSSKKKKEKSKTYVYSDKPPKEKKLTSPEDKKSTLKKKKDKIKHVKEKKRNNEDISPPSRKKAKKFNEMVTESADDDQSTKKAKKRKISLEEVADQDGQEEEEDYDEPNKKKKKKLNKKNNLTNGTEKLRSSRPRQKVTPPVINDVLCAHQEIDGVQVKSRKRSRPKDLSDLEDDTDEGEQAQKRRKKKKRDKTNDFRTVFVGNLPLTITKNQLKKLFSPCGEVENLRMRGAIPANPYRGKKYAILKKAYHSKCRNINAYVCFVDKESADKACELMNGKEVEGLHIRVNSSVIDKNVHDHKRSVFVGNLPFAISEEDVRNHFLDCGEIANIRLVKDWKTGVGKGFGYVKFDDVDSAELAVKLDHSKLNNRKIRVYTSEADPKKRCTDRSRDKGPKSSEKAKVKKSDQKDFVGVKAEKKKKKIKPKHLARKMGLTTPTLKPVEKVTAGPNKHMVFE